MLNLVGQKIKGIEILEKLPRKKNIDGTLMRDKKGKTLPITYLCKCLSCGAVFEATTRKIRNDKGLCECQKQAIKLATLQRLARYRDSLDEDTRCMYQDKDCKHYGTMKCCWDCEDYPQCLELGLVCLNSPAKCGCRA